MKLGILAGNRLGALGRSPHGERGLKLKEGAGYVKRYESLPPRGAWIEMGGWW